MEIWWGQVSSVQPRLSVSRDDGDWSLWAWFYRFWRVLGLAVLSLLLACGNASGIDLGLQKRAFSLWQQRCKVSGEFIRLAVDGVDGIALLKVRTGLNFDDQFRLDDPYGHDSVNDEYLLNFLQGFHHQTRAVSPAGFTPRIGYRFVEARDSVDGRLYRYTGRFEEPWQNDKRFLKGHIRFVMDKMPIQVFGARYGVTYDDISTHEERELWIAGSSLKVIDLQTQTLMAERVGFMVDLAQGSRAGQRSPWLFAADNACPDFNRNLSRPMPGPAAVAQSGQTLDFVEKVLKPTR